MDFDDQIEDMNYMTQQYAQDKPRINLSTLLLIIGQYEQTGDEGQLIEDMNTLGVEVALK